MIREGGEPPAHHFFRLLYTAASNRLGEQLSDMKTPVRTNRERQLESWEARQLESTTLEGLDQNNNNEIIETRSGTQSGGQSGWQANSVVLR